MSRGVNKVIALYLEGNSIVEVSRITGIHRSTVRSRLHKEGVLRSRSEGVLLAAEKGLLGSGLRGKKRPERNKEWCKKISDSKKGKGKGCSLKPNGYIEITMGEHKSRGQHRVLYEHHIGRPLKSDEVVHHKNHNRADNRIENLQLMGLSEHASHHATENNLIRKRNSRGQYQ